MEIDKRPFYVWIMVLLANIGMVLATVLFVIYSHNSLFSLWNLIPLFAFMFVTVVPALISGMDNRQKNYFGYGISVLLLLPLLYSVYDYYTCTGELCVIAPGIIGLGLGILVVVSSLFYAVCVDARNSNAKFVLTIIIIEIVLLMTSVIYFGANMLNWL